MAEVNLMIREANVASDSSEQEPEGHEETWDGIKENHDPPVDHENEYIDEDRFTTVTVEAVDVSKDGLHKVKDDDEDEEEEEKREALGTHGDDVEPQRTTALQGRTGSEKSKRVWTKEPPKGSKKRNKFRYESKAERKATRYKERSGNKAKARARKER